MTSETAKYKVTFNRNNENTTIENLTREQAENITNGFLKNNVPAYNWK